MHRQRFRLTIQLLLVLTAAVAVIASILSSHVHRATAQRELAMKRYYAATIARQKALVASGPTVRVVDPKR